MIHDFDIPDGASEVFVEAEIYRQFVEEALLNEQYVYPKKPQPPIKAFEANWCRKRIEYDTRCPHYQKELAEYDKKVKDIEQESSRKKNLTIWAPWGQVVIKIKGRDEQIDHRDTASVSS